MVAFNLLTATAVGALSVAAAQVEFGYDSYADPKGIYNRTKASMTIKETFWANNQHLVKKAEDLISVTGTPLACEGGSVEIEGVDYPCSNIDFLSLIGRAELKREREEFEDSLFEMSDMWGWLSPSGKEITLACMTNALWFIDGTDPVNPIPLGYIESHRQESFWCDVKVYKDTAYIIQDRSTPRPVLNDRGIQVFDLLRLEEREVTNAEEPVKFEVDYTYDQHGAVHNVIVDVDSGFLYTVGGLGGNDCQGGLHMTDLKENRLEPKFVGCAAQDGYVHDAQCVIYKGPHKKYFGEEICFGYNEDSLTIYNVSDKTNPIIVSKSYYNTFAYTHQGWLNGDQDFLLLNDELDEEEGRVGNTRTYIVDVSSLDDPVFTGFFDHPVESIDHNLYFWGVIHAEGWGGSPKMENPPNPDYAYCTNYASGLRVVDTTNIKKKNPNLRQVGFFDVSPTIGGNQFFGTWSSYMHPSGVIAVTSIESGVFFLNFTGAFTDPIEFAGSAAPTPNPTPAPTPNPTPAPTVGGPPVTDPPSTPTNDPPTTTEGGNNDDSGVLSGLIVFYIFFAAGLVGVAAWQLHSRFLKDEGTEEEGGLLPTKVEVIESVQASRASLRPEGGKTTNPLFEPEP